MQRSTTTSGTFAATAQLIRKAKQRYQNNELSRWWSQKYNRPANDALFLSRSVAAHRMEQYEDLFYKREEALQMLADVSRTRPKEISAQKAVNARRRALIESLNAYNAALSEPLYDDDPIATAWDKALAAGQMPDFGARS